MNKDVLRNQSLCLMLASFLMLFTELALMRWIGANVFLFSFFSNFILIASFLGIALGFLRSSSKLFNGSPILLMGLIAFCYYFRYEYQIKINPQTNELDYYITLLKGNAFPAAITLPVIFILTTLVMTAVASGTALFFRAFAPLKAYRLDILGALLGIGSFTFLSFLNVSPLWWGVVITITYLFLLNKKSVWVLSLQILSLFFMLFILSKENSNATRLWSPYYKIDVQSFAKDRHVVSVNGSPQQIIETVTQRHTSTPFYFFPYQHRVNQTSLDKVLIIGAGTGGDVAIALAQGAKQVDAVEIDPLLFQLGKKLNPDHPYDDKRVKVFVEDGRAFLQRNKELYDVIIFALPDSMMILSGQSSLRLENYLFTQEGVNIAKAHLQPNGIFAMYNYYRERWLIDRLATMLTASFSHSPCLDSEGQKTHWLSVLSISPNEASLQCNVKWQGMQAANVTSDNYPFLYLKEHKIAGTYLLGLCLIFLFSLYAVKMVGSSYKAVFNHLDLFLMGAAFLLLETKCISHFALLFGTTWLVNAMVFFGVLLTVYIAIECTERIKFNVIWCTLALFISLFVAWLTPISYLLLLPSLLRFIMGTLLAFAPLFFANIIFTTRFKQTTHSLHAFAANQFGAVIGGLLEYASLIIGLRDLLIIIAALYLFAIVMLNKKIAKNTLAVAVK